MGHPPDYSGRSCRSASSTITPSMLQRDLRTGRSIWENRRLGALPTRRLTRGRRTDVLVVGAGISGALVAESLVDAGLDVTIVDRRGPTRGSTTASTALLQYEIDTPLTKLASRIGRDRAERIWRRSKLAVDALHERTQRHEIECGMGVRDTLLLEGTMLDARALKQEADARRRAGFEIEFLDRPAVRARYGIARRAAIRSFGNLVADPRRLTVGYLQRATERGAVLLSPVEVTAVESGHRGVLAQTADGPTIRARHVIFATGYELFAGVPRRGHGAASTWAMATKPQPSRLWPSECLIWEASEPYLYMRVGPEGQVICGGEDEEFDEEARRDALLPAKTAAIQRKLKRLLPELDVTAAYAWTGTFGTSNTGTPTIGRVPRMPGCYAVLGYGGNGITFSMLAAQMLRSMIAGSEEASGARARLADSDAALFSFARRR